MALIIYILHYFIIFTLFKVLTVLVRFDPTSYNTTETDGSVTVWIHADRVNESFTVALIPGEGDVIIMLQMK